MSTKKATFSDLLEFFINFSKLVCDNIFMYGEKIKIRRKKAGLSQAELADKINMPRSNISVWEKQSYPPLQFIVEALKVLAPNMTLSEFFHENGKSKKYVDTFYELPLDWIELGKVIFNDLSDEDQAEILELLKVHAEMKLKKAREEKKK